jgi:hypothetical protein
MGEFDAQLSYGGRYLLYVWSYGEELTSATLEELGLAILHLKENGHGMVLAWSSFNYLLGLLDRKSIRGPVCVYKVCQENP